MFIVKGILQVLMSHQRTRGPATVFLVPPHLGAFSCRKKVELLVRQVLNLDRPWRERRDMLSGILSAASVADRQQVVEKLDQRA